MKRLDLLDLARFVAAIGVVCFHYFFNGIANGKISTLNHIPVLVDVAKYGYLGVEFFFMISGYVIFFSSKNRTASAFAVSRAVRLFPAFWAAVLVTSCIAFVWASGAMLVTSSKFLANLTMASPLFGIDYVDGVYWTLSLEISFYFLVFIFIFLGAEGKMENGFIAWPFLIFIFSTVLKLEIPFLAGYYSYFSAGSIFALLKERPRPLAWLALACCLLNCLVFSARRGLRAVDGYHFSSVVVALVILTFFAFFLFLNTNFGANLKISSAKLLGGLTYPVYLLHAHIGYMLMSRFANEDNKAIIIPLVFGAVMLLATVIHLVVEVRCKKFWQVFFERTVGCGVNWLRNKVIVLGA